MNSCKFSLHFFFKSQAKLYETRATKTIKTKKIMTYKTDLFPDMTILFVEKFHFCFNEISATYATTDL